MEYQSLDSQLTGRNAQRRKLGNNTYAERRDNAIAVRLHNTDVVTYHKGGAITFNHGGWPTVTTKARMNEFSPARISQVRGVWFISMPGSAEVVYINGMTHDPKHGWSMVGDDPSAAAKLVKRISKYARDYMAAFDAGNVSKPSAGDCWGCSMRDTTTGKPIMGSDHILSHLDEDYFVPSLLVNAIDRFPVSQAAKAYISDKWAGTDNGAWFAEVGREQLRKSIYRYIKEQLGIAA